MSKTLIILIILVLLMIGFLSRQNIPISAQDNYISVFTCDEPIPTGEAYEETLDLITDVYREYQNVRYYLTGAVEQLNSLVSELSKSQEVCDFSLCQPQVIDQAPDFDIKISWYFGSYTLFGFHIPLCKAGQCIGEPCPNLEEYIADLTAMRNGLEGSYEIVHDMFTKPIIPVTEDIRSNEPAGTLIRRPESAIRKLQLAREWVHSTKTGKRSCSLTDAERKKVIAGELGDRYPMRCTDALREGLYWPRLSTEKCDCEEGATQECKDCLAQNPGTGASVLAQINYKIYGLCKDSCDEELTQECIDCLCIDENGESISEDECVAWICGGSYYNYVCCHETLLEIE